MVDPPGQRSIDKADLMSANGQFSWPPAGRFVAVYGQDLMAADTLSQMRVYVDVAADRRGRLVGAPPSGCGRGWRVSAVVR